MNRIRAVDEILNGRRKHRPRERCGQTGRLDTDLLITRTTRPLSVPAGAMLKIAGAAGADDTAPGRSELKIC